MPGWGADMPTFHAEPDWFRLPPDHPVRTAATLANPLATPTGGFAKIGNVEIETVRNLASVGFDPADAAHHTLLASLSTKDAEALHFVVEEALGGRVVGSDAKAWLERLETDKAGALADARLARRELDADPMATIKFDADGKVLFSSATRIDVPARVVEHVKGVAGTEAKSAVKKFDIEPTELVGAMERVTKAASKSGEDAYVDALANGQPDAKAKDLASKSTRAEAMARAKQEGVAAAERQAQQAVQSGSAFDQSKLDAQSRQQLKDFNANTEGGAAKRLATALPGKKEADFLSAMAKEVADGNCGAPRTIPIHGPPAQTMQMWEFGDGTEIRYKPLGDMDHPKPTFTIEVKKDASVPDQGRDDAAFKVNADGNAVPKNDLELANPYSKHTQKVQYDAFETAVLGPVHFELEP